MKKVISRLKIHDKMRSAETQEEKRSCAINYILNKLNITEAEHKERIIKYLNQSFFAYYFKRLSAPDCDTMRRFETRLAQWLSGDCTFSADLLIAKPPESPSKPTGRKPKAFEDSSRRSQGRKIKELTSTLTSVMLKHAVCVKLREDGDTATAHLIRDCLSTPTMAKEMLDQWRSPERPNLQLSDLVSLNLMKDAKLSKRQYIMVREATMKGKLGAYEKVTKLRHSLWNFETEKEDVLAETTAAQTLQNAEQSTSLTVADESIQSEDNSIQTSLISDNDDMFFLQ